MSERKPQFVHLYLTKSVEICDRNKEGGRNYWKNFSNIVIPRYP